MNTLARYIEEKCAGDRLGAELAALEGGERAALERLIESLRPSANSLREMLRLAQEISRREGAALAEVLNCSDVAAALEAGGSSKERQKRLRQVLERRRYPQLHKLQLELEKCREQILAELGLRLELPPDLEGDTLSVTISGRNARDFEVQGAKITELSAHPALLRIISLLQGEF